MLGQAISHYCILEKLGSGGMGVVYKAQDTNLGRTVALKFLATHLLESEEHKQRFLREAKATASLDHPNICMVHEVGEADGQVFLAMGYIDGPEVRAKIKERPLKLEEALDIIIQAAEGLRAAHQNGVVHRDIKSSNLMLTSSGQVKIMDFGLAQLSGGTRLTKTDTILGTPAYMSPEQAQRLATDRRTDIWSLGVVLYEMVTGRLPFEGEREQAVIYSIISEPHEPVTAIRAGVPLELDRIVSKALAKKPEERYQHLDDMLVDLRALRKTPLTTSHTAPATQPNRRKALWVGAGVVGAVVALAAGLNWDGLGGSGAGHLTVAPSVNAEAHEAYLRGRFHLDNFAARDFEAAEQYFQLALEKDPRSALAYAGLSEVWSHRVVIGVVPPLEAGSRWREAATKAVELDGTLAEAQGALANYKFAHEWDWAGAEAAFRRAVEINPNNAYARAFFSHVLTAMGRPEEGAMQIQAARGLDPLNPFIQGLYALHLMFSRRYDDAITQFRNLLRAAPDFPLGHRGLWHCLHRTGRHEEAFAEVQALYARDPEVSEALVRGYRQGGYPQALSSGADLLAERSRMTFVKPVHVAQMYEHAGNLVKSLEWHERAFELRDHDMAYLAVAPISDTTRNHPRFQALLKQLNFPQ